jgi:hypothetical protein
MADDADARDAQITLRRLEERGDTHTLRVLASLYADLAERAYRDSAVLDATVHLREAARARDAVYRRSSAGELVDRLRADGLEILEPPESDHPVDLRRYGSLFGKLAREVREAAEAVAG